MFSRTSSPFLSLRYSARAVFSAWSFNFATKPHDVSTTTKKHLEVYVAHCGFAKKMTHGARREDVYGEDACFVSSHKGTHVVGVADGVGGWNAQGVDPSLFSSRLMFECKQVAETGAFEPTRPQMILDKAFTALKAAAKEILGSSTACLAVIHDDAFHAANLGDSGFIIVRDGKILCQSKEQLHFFNAPFQLSSHPPGGRFLSNLPKQADEYHLKLRTGDVIMLATDGLWDNVPVETIVDEMSRLNSPKKLESVCKTIALTALQLSADPRPSPFALKARAQGRMYQGGKPDDITIVLLYVL
ncbi:unnamed protein product, partial [Mesorhabditis spiculigera]